MPSETHVLADAVLAWWFPSQEVPDRALPVLPTLPSLAIWLVLEDRDLQVTSPLRGPLIML